MFGVAGQRASLLTPGGARLRSSASALGSYAVWAACWIAGHICGGVLLGAAAGWMGAGLAMRNQVAALTLLSAACVAAALHQFNVIRLPLPELPRQVQRLWIIKYPWNLLAIGFGLQLGCAVATRVKVATTHVVLGCALLSGSAVAGGLILGSFGAARSVLPILIGPRVARPEKSLSTALAFDAYEGLVGKLNGAFLLMAAIWLINSSWRLV